MCDLPEDLESMDTEAFFNIREYVSDALIEKGAEITDAGMGFGCADLGILIDGMPFSVSIKPRIK